MAGGWQLTVEARYQRSAISVFRHIDRPSSGFSIAIGIGYDRARSHLSVDANDDDDDEPTGTFIPVPLGPPEAPESTAEEDRTSAERDPLYIILGAVSCFRSEPRILTRIASLPGDASLFQLAYTRHVTGETVTLRNAGLLESSLQAPRLERCIEEASEGLSWADSVSGPESETLHTSSVPAGLVREILREIRAHEAPRK